MNIPVYIFTGFIESGKTTLIKSLLRSGKIQLDGGTLLVLLENGREHIDGEFARKYDLHITKIDSVDELTPEHLDHLLGVNDCANVIVECNGMWPVVTVYRALPAGWHIVKKLMCADSRSILSYSRNMDKMVRDKCQSCDAILFSRMSHAVSRKTLHDMVRKYSVIADIFYDTGYEVPEADHIADLPLYTISDGVTDISDSASAFFLRDCERGSSKLLGKTFHMQGIALLNGAFGSNRFLFGRNIIQYSAKDMAFHALPCIADGQDMPENNTWIDLTAAFISDGGQPALRAMSIAGTYPPRLECGILL